jgi:SAM-dependent methyltransferase
MSSHHVFHGLLMAAKPRALVAAIQTLRQTIGRTAPDHRRSLRSYGAIAQTYELRTSSGDHGRRELVECLAPRAGEVILDVGCGSGRNFEQIRRRIGPSGRLIGIEPSPEMLAQARALVERRGWTNVDLICATAEEATIPVEVDAAILCAVHDVMRSSRALANILQHIRPAGRIAAGGPKWVSWRKPGTITLNLVTWRLNRDCVTTFEGFTAPWNRLAELVEDLQVDERYGGAGYVAAGRRVA